MELSSFSACQELVPGATRCQGTRSRNTRGDPHGTEGGHELAGAAGSSLVPLGRLRGGRSPDKQAGITALGPAQKFPFCGAAVGTFWKSLGLDDNAWRAQDHGRTGGKGAGPPVIPAERAPTRSPGAQLPALQQRQGRRASGCRGWRAGGLAKSWLQQSSGGGRRADLRASQAPTVRPDACRRADHPTACLSGLGGLCPSFFSNPGVSSKGLRESSR